MADSAQLRMMKEAQTALAKALVQVACGGVASVSIDGINTTFQSLEQIQKAQSVVDARIGQLTGARPIFRQMTDAGHS